MSWFDLQVNGYAGVDFNQDDLNAEQLHAACERLRLDGAEGILATIITDRLDLMETRLRRLARLREQDTLVRQVVVGFHVEGPFISRHDGFRGAHPASEVREADESAAQRLVAAGDGLVRIFTLAPEMDSGATVTHWLAKQGITVSAGHTNADLGTLRAAVQAGLKMFTHVGNGCPAGMPRHDNIIQRALSLRQDLWLCFIGDGVHISDPAFGNYLELVEPYEKCLVTSDAMAAAGMGPGRYRLGRWEVDVGEDLAARAPGDQHLVGSAMSLGQVQGRLRETLSWSSARIDRLTYHAPRRAIGL